MTGSQLSVPLDLLRAPPEDLPPFSREVFWVLNGLTYERSAQAA
jgi:hypothetical protein